MLLVTFEQMITNPLCILAILSVAFGMACTLLAKKITKVVKKIDTVEDNDKMYFGFVIAGVSLILLGFVFLTIWGMGAL